MKKAFNFRTLLACALIFVMCLTAFVACDKDKEQEQPYDANGINMAVRALKANVRGSSVNADFTLDNHQMFAGVSYPVSWAITANDGEASDVTLTVDGDKTTVHVNGKTKKDVAFTLTATVSDAKGLTATAEFKYSIPAYKLLTHAEYIATKAGEAVTVQGIVSHYGSKSNGAQYNNLFMYDQDGGYYIYTIANSVDPANIQGLHLGAKVEVTGKKDIYNGTHEVKDATIKVIDSSTQAVFEDITDVFKSATTISDAALAAYEYKLVTIKNVEIGDIDDSEKHNYYFFKSGSLETYIRLSTSECMLNAEQQAAFKTAFAADKGKLATVKGCVVLYNGQLYLNPVDTTPYTIVNTEGLSAQEQVNFAVGNTFVQSTVSGNGSSITLPTVDSIFNDVKITWSVDKTDLCAIADGKATFTFLTDNTVKLTATFTHSTDASATATKDFTITLKGAELITIAELYDKAVGDTAYYVEGYVVAVDKASDGKCSFVLQDGTASIFSYNKLDVKLGDHVKVLAKRSSDSYGFPQLGSISYEKLADGTFEPAVNEMAITDVKITKEDAPADLYTKKYWKITGATIVKGDYGYQGNINYVDASNPGTQVISLKLNAELEALAATLVGKTVNIYGYSRGINTAVKYFTVQANKLEEVVVEKTDEEIVNDVLAAIKPADAVRENFKLGTSDAVESVAWTVKSGTAAVIGENGVDVTITRGNADAEVVFTVTVKKGTITKSADYTVTVKANSTIQAGVKGEAGKAYKLGMNHTGLNKELFINGEMSSFYFATVEDINNAIDVYVEVVGEDTYRLYTQKGTTKKYIEAINAKGTDGKNHINVKFNDTATEGIVWKWDDTRKTYALTIEGVDYVLGTRSDKTYNTLSANKVSDNPIVAKLYEEVVVVEKTDAEKVAQAKAALDLASKTFGTGEVKLQATGLYDSKITWKSDNAAIAIAADGITATIVAGTTDTSVKLTATITLNGESTTKEFNVTVTATTPEYTVTFANVTGATVDVQVDGVAIATGAKVEQGKTLTISVTVDTTNYKLVSVMAGATTLEAVDGVYTHQVAGDVVISVTVKELLNTPEKIMDAAYALNQGESLDGEYTLTGTITQINTAFDSQFNNITVTIKVAGKTIQCFRLACTATDVFMVNDTITVTGTIKNHYGTVEFDAGCTFKDRVVGTSTITVDSNSSANATVTIVGDLTEGTNGTDFSFTVAVASGHELVSVKVNGTAVVAAEGQYTCTINGDMVITVETKVAGAADPVVVASLTFPDANKANNATSAYNKTWTAKTSDGVEFTISNFNNDSWSVKNNWTYIRCGSKNGASVASIATKAVMANAINKVVVTIDKVTASAVNSIKLTVASDADFKNIVETVDGTVAQGEMTFNVAEANRAANLYYKVEFDCNKGTKNGFVQVSKVEFYGLA